MNIKRAKEEIIHTIKAYFQKDSYGEYVIPVVHQRPVLLLGAPGIGKTRIMEQIASECGIALVSYTITHHTRQSAIGLPFISHETFGGRETAVTEYTMSEIVASLYQKMKQTGLSEGILFIDEINCVSETLAPAMLQFLQCKSFGNHQIPQGWIIVAAGNPPEYNKSVREFDVVTLDRVKKIDVEPDFDVWKEYARDAAVHPAVISYLNARPLHFYKMETTIDGKLFATPRGWEDLSRILQVYEDLSITMDSEVVVQYIQHPDIAKDFAAYLELYAKYQADYELDQVFEGHIPDILIKKTAHASFDERLSLVSLLLARCETAFRKYCMEEDYVTLLHGELKRLRDHLIPGAPFMPAFLESMNDLRQTRETRQRAELLGRNEKITRLRAEEFFDKALPVLQTYTGDDAFSLLRDRFGTEKDAYDESFEAAGCCLEYAFDFLEAAFGTGQELVWFITELNTSRISLRFLEHYACERYDRYNQSLLYEDRSRAILRRLEALD